MQTGSESRLSFDAPADEESRLVYPANSSLFPTIEQAALATRPAGATEVAVAVGLGAGALQLCSGALAGVAMMVVTHDCSAATDLVTVLRARLVVSAALLASRDGARLLAAAESCGAQLVRVEPDASAALIVWLVRRAATLAFARTPMLGDVQRQLVRAKEVSP